MKRLLLILLFIPFFGISQKACNVFGKIKFVEYGEDYKVKFVDYGENIKFKYISCGEDKIGAITSANKINEAVGPIPSGLPKLKSPAKTFIDFP